MEEALEKIKAKAESLDDDIQEFVKNASGEVVELVKNGGDRILGEVRALFLSLNQGDLSWVENRIKKYQEAGGPPISTKDM